MRATEEQITAVKKILADNGIRMSIWSCGCCETPVVSIEKDGVLIVDKADFFNIDTFTEPQAAKCIIQIGDPCITGEVPADMYIQCQYSYDDGSTEWKTFKTFGEYEAAIEDFKNQQK